MVAITSQIAFVIEQAEFYHSERAADKRTRALHPLDPASQGSGATEDNLVSNRFVSQSATKTSVSILPETPLRATPRSRRPIVFPQRARSPAREVRREEKCVQRTALDGWPGSQVSFACRFTGSCQFPSVTDPIGTSPKLAKGLSRKARNA